MNADEPLSLSGDSAVYRFRKSHRFHTVVTQRSRLFTPVLPCLAGIGCLYQALAGFRDRREYAPPGTLVSGGDCHLHVLSAGEGAPSVILESGLGGICSGWTWVHSEVAKFSRVISYDRAGLGWSGPDPGRKSAVVAALRLRAALRQGGVLPPFVLVGHSMGGLFVRVFADQFRDETAGMVLVDAVHPDQHLRSSAIRTHMDSGFRFLKAVPFLARLGYIRLSRFFRDWGDGLPARQAAEAEAMLADCRHLRSTLDESLAWNEICAEVRCAGGLGDLPLAVVTAGSDVLPGQPELQRELASLSSDSVHLVVENADHVTLVTRREHALRVADAVRHVVRRAEAAPNATSIRGSLFR
ncbi:alpha/beta fold hydrolase [Citrifermentans bremense]|uniref:alpha/beta fold hydrolase n=1 Tax=Citrifermentans bremense TaxID=60035 RepID=UPI0003FD8328|nr:alpha/beta hydrolase [Citrifermentans bremense]